MNRRYMSYHKKDDIFPEGESQPIWWIHVHYRSLLLPHRKEKEFLTFQETIDDWYGIYPKAT